MLYLTRYDYFGEDTVLLDGEGAKRYEAVSSTAQYTGLFVLDKTNVKDILSMFPLLKKNVGGVSVECNTPLHTDLHPTTAMFLLTQYLHLLTHAVLIMIS
jgi:hypothetical protein